MSKGKSNVVLNSVLLTAAQKVQETTFFDDPERHRDILVEVVEDIMTTTYSDNIDYRNRAIVAVNSIREMADLCIVLQEDIKACNRV
jgi:hypothetical protein